MKKYVEREPPNPAGCGVAVILLLACWIAIIYVGQMVYDYMVLQQY